MKMKNLFQITLTKNDLLNQKISNEIKRKLELYTLGNLNIQK